MTIFAQEGRELTMKCYTFGEKLDRESLDTPIMVICGDGEGDDACAEALRLSTMASRVYLVTRASSLLASEYLQLALFECALINVFYFTEVLSIKEDSVVLRDIRFGSSLVREVPILSCVMSKARAEKLEG